MNEQFEPVSLEEEELEASYRADSEAVKRAKDGDEAAFEELWIKYHEPMLHFAQRLTGNLHDAEDVVQSTFMTLYQKIDMFEDRHKGIGGWLTTATRNQFINSYRQNRRRHTTSLDEIQDCYKGEYDRSRLSSQTPEDDPEHTVVQRQMLGWVAAELAQRRPVSRDRIARLYLHEVEGYKVEEIAEMTGDKMGTVLSGKSRLMQDAEALKEELKAGDEKDARDSWRLVS